MLENGSDKLGDIGKGMINSFHMTVEVQMNYVVEWIEGSWCGVSDQAVIATPFGRLLLQTRGDVVVAIDWVEKVPLRAANTAKLAQVINTLQASWQNAATAAHCAMPIPLLVQGTPFQQRVWRALCEIPCGEVMTYHALATQLGSSARAIGQACCANPYPLVVPCHRVVAARGLGGYCGATAGLQSQRKQHLLDFERVSR